MTNIFSDLLQNCMEVFMDDFTVYAESFDACLENLSKVLTRGMDTNLVLNFEKCHFMVTEGIVLGDELNADSCLAGTGVNPILVENKHGRDRVGLDSVSD
ncbi:hypothetical protein CR513_62727, partial [Mucuna pruriens]